MINSIDVFDINGKDEICIILKEPNKRNKKKKLIEKIENLGDI